MGVSRRRWRHLPCGFHHAPLQRVEVELVEIVQVLGTIMPTDHEHTILVRHGRCPVACLGHGSLDRHYGPLPLREVVAVKIAPVVPIVTRENVHGAIVFHTGVAVARSRWVPQCRVHRAPDLVLGIVLPEVVYTVVAVVAGEDVDFLGIGHDNVPVTCRRATPCGVNLRPLRSLEAELVEVVHPAATIVPSKDVEAIAHDDARMQRSLLRRLTAAKRLDNGPLVDGRLAALHIIHLHLRLSGGTAFHLQNEW
mmetsp:Transcript_73488/g.172367  ORF Transcript_73488/g.172367 Transcript_73488/m.172367 type:complete len:252 (-) Transcript_73488:66-821(-)